MARVLGGEDAEAALGHLFDVWDTVHEPSRPFDERLERLLDLETEAYDLPYGFLSRIDEDTQTIEAAHGAHEELRSGETCPLSESYCRKTVRQPDGCFHVDDALAEGWGDDPAYERFELGTYVGTTVEVDDDVYGTLCFASTDPRDDAITPAERRLLDRLGRWVADELDDRTARARHDRRADRIENLARAVSHDLRNPLNVAQGQVKLLEDTIGESVDRIESAHQRMTTIIEQMQVLARVDEPVTDPEAVDLRACVHDTWAMVPTGAATVDYAADSVHVAADRSRLESLLENLFRNAVEHGSTGNRTGSDDAVEHGSTGNQPTDDGGAVTVTVGLLPDGFYVADDGPGIPESDRDVVFDPGYSTTEDGTGFGLNIVDRIADAHGWTVTATDGGGARFEFTGVEFVDAPR
jgi:signal transduction histidine kinase